MVDKRLRYFDGQFLQDQDFIDEQDYHLDRQRRPVKSLTVAGVCEGLTVTAGSEEVTVAPGMAIDPEGRQMVLESQENIPLTDVVPQPGQTQQVNLFIAYQEEASDPATAGSQGNRRWYEKPQITVLDVGESQPANAVKLAKLTVEADGNAIVDPSVCEHSGLHLPNGNGNGAILRYQTNGSESRPILTGDLTVTGNVGIGTTTSPQKKLHVSGELKVDASHDNSTADIAAFLANNGTQGIGIGKNRLQAIGSDEHQDIELYPKGTGKVNVYGDLQVENNLNFVGETNGNPSLRQVITLYDANHGIGVQGQGVYFRTGKNFAWYKQGNHNDGELNGGTGTVQMAIADGNLGIGTISPEKKLHVESGELKVKASHDDGTADIAAFLANNGVQGIGIGSNRLQAIGSAVNQDIELYPKGTGKVKVFGDLQVENNLNFDNTKLRQMITLWDGAHGIGIQESTVYFRTGKNFAWYKLGDHNDAELNSGGGIPQMAIADGNVGIGKVDPQAKLDVAGDIKVNGIPPIRFEKYANLGDNVRHNTGISATEYNAAIIGFRTGLGEVKIGTGIDILKAYMYIADGKWHIRADFAYNGENWSVDVMFVSVQISETKEGFGILHQQD